MPIELTERKKLPKKNSGPPPAEKSLGLCAIAVFLACFVTGGFVCNWFSEVTVVFTNIVLTSDVIRKICAIMCLLTSFPISYVIGMGHDRQREDLDNMEDHH